MATNNKTKAATEEVCVSASVYTAEELAKNHKVFNASYEIVTVALRKAGKKEATIAEAQKIIDKFKTKEVK